MFPAFKEWHLIIEALCAGDQSIILRKGGISENPGGFDPVAARRFWLFPTHFHAQREKTKPSAAHRFPPAFDSSADASFVTLRAFAEVTRHAFLDHWPAIAALDAYHAWTEAAVREKFDWNQPPGLHFFIVRVHLLDTPLRLPLNPSMGGCTSWIQIPPDFTTLTAKPVLSDARFTALESTLSRHANRQPPA